jgi:hypothetical protein
LVSALADREQGGHGPQHCGVQVRAGHHRRRQSHPQRLLGPDPAGGQADLGGSGVADEIDEPLGAAQVRDQAKCRFGHGEGGIVGQDAQVAAERELETGADGVALDRGDADEIRPRRPVEGLLPFTDRVARLLLGPAGQDQHSRNAGHPLGREHRPVEAGREATSLTPDHHHPDGSGQRPCDLPQRGPGVGSLGVQGLGAGEPDRRHERALLAIEFEAQTRLGRDRHGRDRDRGGLRHD